jgi:hypothetical protein
VLLWSRLGCRNSLYVCRLTWSTFERCPELRELINHYWERDESGRGGLEIRLGIPGHVMGCICRYLQTGIYTPPCHMADLLQVNEYRIKYALKEV